MTVARAILLATAALVSSLVTAFGAPSEASAWSEGACTTTDGVTVVIDFQELGGGVHVRCASQPITSGLDALRQAGIDYRTSVRQPGFLCRIAGKPESDPCVTTSPATAYWSYWLAPRGGRWCFSNLGAGNRVPPPGSVEGWSFALNRSATTAPPPRFAIPPAVPGSPAAPLSPADCAGESAAPATTVAPAVSNSPEGHASSTSPAEVPSPEPSRSTGRSDDGSTPGVPSAPADNSARGDAPPGDTNQATVDVPTTNEDLTATTDSANSPATDEEQTDGSDRASSDTAAGSETAESTSGSVDLGRGSKDAGSPLGVVAAAILVAALGGAAAHLRSRQRATEQG